MQTRTSLSALLVATLLAVTPASADLTGDTVTGSFTPNNFSGFSGLAEVGAGREFQAELFPGVDAFADLTANTVTVGFEELTSNFFVNGLTGIWLFEDLDWLPLSGEVTGLTFLSQSGSWTGDPSTWTLTHGTDWIQMSGGIDFNFFPPNDTFASATFQIETRHVVPAPGAAVLAMLGLPAVAWVKRRFQ